jgi:endonuclease/exonuclease/phosphatase family metal-dependent hydrolase
VRPATFHAATFNVLHGRSVDDGRVDLDRFAEAVRRLDADVLALQEVDRGQPRSYGADLTAIAAHASGAVASRFAPALVGLPGSWRRADGEDSAETSADASADASGEAAQYGVALVSRFPVSSWRVVRLPAMPGRVPVLFPGRRRPVVVRDEPRVAVVARVELPDGPATFACTHLSFIPWWNLVQLHKLTRALPRDLPLVLMGDLNLQPDAAVRTTGLHPLASDLTFPVDEPYEQIDHLLGRGVSAVGPGVATRLPLSDHRALSVEVALRGG